MKGRLIAVDRRPDGAGEMAALMVDGQLEDLFVDPPETLKVVPGQVWRAKADRAMKGQGGIFVRLGGGETGFLRDYKGIAPGETVLVQVATHAEPGKAAPVTRRLALKSRYALATPGQPGLNISRSIRDPETREALEAACRPFMSEGIGLVIRTVAGRTQPQIVAEDAAAMVMLAETIAADCTGPPELLLDAVEAGTRAWQEWPEPDAADIEPGSFERLGVWDALETARDPRVRLEFGASMVIEPTRALVAVDVNTGNDTSPAAGLKANIAALEALPKALRVRGLGGQIVLDMAPMGKRDRPKLEAVAKVAFRADSVESQLIGWTPLGHMEVTRKRERLPLWQVLPR